MLHLVVQNAETQVSEDKQCTQLIAASSWKDSQMKTSGSNIAMLFAIIELAREHNATQEQAEDSLWSYL